MDGLTAKVFRTYNASVTLQEQLRALTRGELGPTCSGENRPWSWAGAVWPVSRGGVETTWPQGTLQVWMESEVREVLV